MARHDLHEPLRVLRWATLNSAARNDLLARGRGCFDEHLRERVRGLIEDVRLNGDDAVARALVEYDDCAVHADGLAIEPSELARARDTLPRPLLDAIRDSIGRVRRFNERVLADRDWMVEVSPGIEAGQRLAPIASAGLFVPSGKGSYPSSLYQVAVAAVVAGVPEISIVVPPTPGGGGAVDQATLAVAHELGVERVFRANGPAGIAALAFGTETIPQAVKVLGPGSPAVQATQIELQRHGTVTLMIMGPTESLVIADSSADPGLLAADLLTEAEHGSDSAAVLVTPDAALIEAAQGELRAQLAALPEQRRVYARSALGEVGGAVLVEDLEQAAEVANLYAPEHLQLATSRAAELVPLLDNAAEILLGQATPFAAANYTIGIPAALPTGRFARVSSGVTADAFTKTISVGRVLPEGARAAAAATAALADWEGFPAHAAAVRLRSPA